MAKRGPNEGQADECRNCGDTIFWGTRDKAHQVYKIPTPTDRYYGGHYRDWWHLAPVRLDEVNDGRLCDKDKVDKSQGWASVRAQPKSWCAEHITSDRSCDTDGICNRAITDPELLMCGIHASRVRKERQEEEARSAKMQMRSYLENALAHEILPALRSHGFEGEVELHKRYVRTTEFPLGTFETTGKIVVDPEELLEFLNSIQEVL